MAADDRLPIGFIVVKPNRRRSDPWLERRLERHRRLGVKLLLGLELRLKLQLRLKLRLGFGLRCRGLLDSLNPAINCCSDITDLVKIPQKFVLPFEVGGTDSICAIWDEVELAYPHHNRVHVIDRLDEGQPPPKAV